MMKMILMIAATNVIIMIQMLLQNMIEEKLRYKYRIQQF
jgi:hypothetical protein